jgi:hypothetical protein
MTPPGLHEQPVEIVDKSLGASPLVGKPLSFGFPNAALDAVLVKLVENLIERGR